MAESYSGRVRDSVRKKERIPIRKERDGERERNIAKEIKAEKRGEKRKIERKIHT